MLLLLLMFSFCLAQTLEAQNANQKTQFQLALEKARANATTENTPVTSEIPNTPPPQNQSQTDKITQLEIQLQIMQKQLEQLSQTQQDSEKQNQTYREKIQDLAAAPVVSTETGMPLGAGGMATRVSKVEADLEALKTTQADIQEGIPDWLKNLTSFEGDFKYSHAWEDDSESRGTDTMHDIRARIALMGKINPEVDMIFRIGAQKTLGGSFGDMSGDDIFADLAYFDYHPGTVEKLPFLGVGVDLIDNISPFYELDGLRGIHILGGKFEDPYYHSGNSGLIDIGNPEGMAGMVNKEITENLNLFGSFGGYWVENRDSDEVDTSLWGVQVGGTQRLVPEEDIYLTAGAAYYNYGNVQGQEALDDDFGGNSISGGEYDNDYDLINVSAELGFPLYDMPVRLFGDGVCNMRANTGGRTGYVVGFGINETEEPGDWYFFYNFQEVESDAVVDNFSGSCFNGGANGRGHVIEFGYKIAHNCVLDIAYCHGENSIDSDRSTLKTLSLELSLKF